MVSKMFKETSSISLTFYRNSCVMNEYLLWINIDVKLKLLDLLARRGRNCWLQWGSATRTEGLLALHLISASSAKPGDPL